MIDTLTPEQAEALDVARSLAAAGIPVFVAHPDTSAKPGSTGYRLPRGWESTPADPSVVDAWRPGMAIAVVMGHGLDLLDVDPRSGGDVFQLNGATPTSYGAALTPSGGVHSFIRSLGVRSRDKVVPGIDIKAGDAEGRGRGFAFIAPTVRISKTTGQPATYQWVSRPDVTRLRAVVNGELVDDSGRSLAALIAEVRSARDPEPAAAYSGPGFDDMPVDLQQTVTGWVQGAVAGICAELQASAGWPDGHIDDRGRGWEKLQADAALRLGQLARAAWNDYELVDAEAAFKAAAPVDGSWGTDDVELKWSQQALRREAAPWPNLRSPAERDAEAWQRLGVAIDEIPLAQAPVGPGGGPGGSGPGGPVVAAGGSTGPPDGPPDGEDVAARYFGPGGIQAATMAGDTLALGPLRVGRDDLIWSYSGGVWCSDKHAVRERLARMLGQRFRTAYVGTVEAMVRAYVDTITCEPVAELVNFRNGLLDWRTGELHPHTPEVPSTVQLGIDYDPHADCPAFEEFISQVVPADVVPTIWELIGYLMFSGNPLHKAVMLTGTGRNGKGTFLRVVETVLGARNVTSISLHDLVNTRFSTAELFGKLANVAGDIDAGYLENTATFKGITGGDTISAEHKGRDRFDFKPWAVPMFSANKIPASADTTDGYLSRWLVVPFPHNFTGREDRHLDAKLHTSGELQGVAARGIRALGGLLARGDFEMTESGEVAREEFIRRVDQVRTWLADCCEVRPDHPWVARTELYADYKQWAFRDGHRPVRATEFYERLEAGGGEPAIMHGTRGFKRILVIDTGIPGPGMTVWQTPNPTVPHPGAQTPLALPAGASTTQGAAPEDVSAPNLHPDVFAGQLQLIRSEGAQGAETPHPPYARVRVQGGYEKPAPSAPNPPEPTERTAKPASKQARTVEATQAAAEAREAKRLDAIRLAAGADVKLPAVVTRDGVIRECTLQQADGLLRTVTLAAGPVTTELTVDVETSGFPVGHHDYALRTIQLGDENFAIVLDAADMDHAALAKTHLREADVLHAHSATADLVPLAVAGHIDYEEALGRMVDTAVLAKLADPNSTDNSADLKGLAKAVLGDAAVAPRAEEARSALFKAGKWLTDTEVTTEPERSGWGQVDHGTETMVRYDASDVLDCAALARRLPALDPNELARERLAQTMTARIAYRGVRIDGDQVGALLPVHEEAKDRHAERITGAYGIENPGSPAQVGARLVELGARLPQTPTGKPSVAEGVLEPLVGDRSQDPQTAAEDLARLMIDWREHDTALKLFLRPYDVLVRRGDGRARPTVYTLGAKTGRMSCVRPNLQQLPREGGFRACITADPGYLLVSADFASVELRVAAALSGDRRLLDMLEEADRNPEAKNDLHWQVARIAFGPGATKANRYAAKRGVFGRIYGGGVGAIARGVGVPDAKARAIIEAMDALTPGLTEWSRMTREGIEAGRTRFQAYSGRTIHLPKAAAHAGPNYCIQGTARELLIDALERWRQTPWAGCTLWPVHDEVVVMVPEAQAADATATLVQCMTSTLFGVQIKAEASEPTYAWADSV